MNHNEEVPDFLGGLGDMLPADVLKKVNELLERVHRKDKDHQGSPVFIYAPGSQYVDKQFNFGAYHRPLPKGKGAGKPLPEAFSTEAAADPPFDADTPLSALFRENHHEELRRIIDSWRPYLIGDDPTIDALALAHFEFDFDKVIATHIYIDLGRLLYVHALKDDNMSQLAKYLYQHSNLSNSESTLYVQLRKYKKR